MFDRPVNVFPLPLLLYSSTPTIDAASHKNCPIPVDVEKITHTTYYAKVNFL